MTKYILVKVDTNDGDYVTEFKPLQYGDLEKIQPMIDKISACEEDHNFDHHSDGGWENNPYGGYVSKENEEEDIEVYDTFMKYCPSTEYGFHTIETIEIYDVRNVELLFEQ